MDGERWLVAGGWWLARARARGPSARATSHESLNGGFDPLDLFADQSLGDFSDGFAHHAVRQLQQDSCGHLCHEVVGDGDRRRGWCGRGDGCRCGCGHRRDGRGDGARASLATAWLTAASPAQLRATRRIRLRAEARWRPSAGRAWPIQVRPPVRPPVRPAASVARAPPDASPVRVRLATRGFRASGRTSLFGSRHRSGRPRRAPREV